jgi:phosphatidylglycerol:prolipoprotein diacylglycerol transferase
MIFPNVDDIPRHPSQLYESFFEGLILFLALWIYSNKKRKTGQISALFLILYGAFRFFIEFTREPDQFLGLLFLNLSMGQWLSIPMIVAGIYLFKKS